MDSNTNFQPNTLGIDFGTKRIGIAISKASLAEPLVILDNNQDVFDEIKKICDKFGVEQIVMGISEQEMAEKTVNFSQELKKELELPVFFADETLSSQTVRKQLKEAGVGKQKRSQPIDHLAAAQILQEWLDSQS